MDSAAAVAAPHSRLHASTGALALAAYLGAVCLVAELPALLGISREALVHAVAFSPVALVHGRLWLLPLSGLAVDGDTTAQVAALAPVSAAVMLLAGAPRFWGAAVAGHVGSTLIAYTLVGMLLVVAPHSVRQVLSAPDYGISCVWTASLGALAVAGARRCDRPATKLAMIGAASLPMIPSLAPGLTIPGGTLRLATLEHGLAFLLGAAALAVDWSSVRRLHARSLRDRVVAWVSGPRRPPRSRPVPLRPSARTSGVRSGGALAELRGSLGGLTNLPAS